MKISQFRSLVPQIKLAIEEQTRLALAELANKIASDAKDMIGKEQADWEPLAPSTQIEKSRKGEDGGPLFASGKLHDSIKVDIEGLHASIGTDEPEAVYLETGTEKMPPRKFLSKAATANAEKVEEAFAYAILKAFKTL